MCYSAMIEEDYRKYLRVVEHEDALSKDDFVRIYWPGAQRVHRTKAMDLWFGEPRTDTEREIKALIDEGNKAAAAELEQDLVAQRQRVANAAAKLELKPWLKGALEDVRIGSNKIRRLQDKIADLTRTTREPGDGRFWSNYYVPVIVAEHGRRVIKPMRSR